MSNISDEQFKLDVTSKLSEIASDTKYLAKRLDEYMIDNDKRVGKLEHIIVGNGTPGLSEEVRSIKGRWGAVVGIVIFLASVASNALVAHFYH